MQKYDRWLSDSYVFFVPEKSSLKPILGQFFLILMGITAMWVKMRNFSMKALLIWGIAATIFAGCSEDEKPNIVKVSEVAGDYVAATAYYLLQADGSLATISANGIEFNLDLVKITVNGNKIIAKNSEDDLIFESVNAVEASNGVAFNLALPAEIISHFETLGYSTAGFEKYQLDNKKYHAFYDAKEKTIDFSLVFIANEVQVPDIVLEFACSK
ncbi:MAG: hypothetical protein LBP72_10695 [Dysgonamonadaceae bacterium]|jgi:hypothetical protein|nr:hypothetical protein [Dysgonamonadaceae bacterium]